MKEAIQFFERAGRYNHAVRLAKEEGYDAELMNLSLQSSKETMVDVARYFEQRGVHDKAVQLYQKGGNIPKALDLCFRANLFDDLRIIGASSGVVVVVVVVVAAAAACALVLVLVLVRACLSPNFAPSHVADRRAVHPSVCCRVASAADELGDDTPPEVLSRCSDFFIDHGQFEKAVHLQITAKKYNEVRVTSLAVPDTPSQT